ILGNSGSLVIGVDGALYFGTTNYGIRRITTDGLISKYADIRVEFGGGSAGGSWLAAARDGSIYYLDAGRGTVNRISAAGDILRIAGTGARATRPATPGAGALETPLAPWSLAVGPDNAVYFGEWFDMSSPSVPIGGRVRKIDLDGNIVNV